MLARPTRSSCKHPSGKRRHTEQPETASITTVCHDSRVNKARIGTNPHAHSTKHTPARVGGVRCSAPVQPSSCTMQHPTRIEACCESPAKPRSDHRQPPSTEPQPVLCSWPHNQTQTQMPTMKAAPVCRLYYTHITAFKLQSSCMLMWPVPRPPTPTHPAAHASTRHKPVRLLVGKVKQGVQAVVLPMD